MRKIFIALCTMVSVITGNAQNTPIGENIELAGENPELFNQKQKQQIPVGQICCFCLFKKVT